MFIIYNDLLEKYLNILDIEYCPKRQSFTFVKYEKSVYILMYLIILCTSYKILVTIHYK